MRIAGSINFLPQFVEPVLSGTKTQTIRHARRFPPRPGEILIFKCGGESFGKAVVSDVLPVRFFAGETPMIFMHGKVLSASAEEELAAMDGLTAAELKKFLRNYSRNKNEWNEYIAIRWNKFTPDE
jgi:hypothetical protein